MNLEKTMSEIKIGYQKACDMGATTSAFTEDILDEYTTLTYLSKTEILHLYKMFSMMGDDKLQDLDYRFSISHVEEVFPQLKYNVFKDRIFRVFSSKKDNCLSFEDILDLCSVMSEKCPDKVKSAWAFRIFDYDEDGFIGGEDLMNVMDKLTDSQSGNQIEDQQKKEIIQLLLKEIDLESKGSIGQLEFQHAIGKMSEFSHSFTFRI